jgi:coatomer protein complex subunit gamma
VKHVFKEHLVLQFNCTNTVEGVLLEDTGVELEVDGDGWELESEVKCPEIKYGSTGTCYVCLSRSEEDDGFATKANVECELKFNLIDVDPATGEHESEGFEELFPLEPVSVTTADFLAKVTVPDFRATWEQMGEDNQAAESFGLKFKTIGEAVSRCIDFIGMQPCENTAVAQPKSKTHMILLSGVFVGGVKVLARCHLKLDPNATAGGSILKIIVRCNDANVSQLVADGFDDPNV